MATFRADNGLTAGTRTNSTLTKPTNTAENDILIIALAVENDTAMTPPTGFKLGVNIDHADTTNIHDLWVWWKRAGASEGASYQVTHSSTWTAGWIVAVEQASTSVDPWFGVANQGTGTSRAAAGVTPLGNDACIVFVGASFNDHGASVSAPAGSTPTFTEQHDETTNLYAATGTLATAQATGDKTHTIATGPWEAVLCVVEDDATTSGNPPPWLVASGALSAAASGTSITPTIPSGAEANDIMVFAAMANGSTTFSTPTDWNVLGTAIESNADQSSEFFWKRHDGTESNPTSTTSATLSTTIGGYGRIWVFRGCHTSSDPFEDTTMAGSPTSDTTPDTAAIDTTDVNRLVVSLLVVDDDNTWSSGMPPSGWYNASGRVSSTTGGDAMYDGIAHQKPTSGSVAAAVIGTQSAADFWRSITFALIPPAAAGGGTATPGVIGLSVALPAPTISGAGNVSPAVIARSVTLPAPTAQAGGDVSPAVIARSVALPAPTVSGAGNTSPAVIPLAVTMPAPSTGTGGTAAPDVIARTVALPAATVTGAGNTSPAVIPLAVAVPAASATGGGAATATPAAITLAVTIPAPTVTGAGNAVPAVIPLAVTIPAASGTGGGNRAPAAITLNVTIPQASATGGGAGNASPAVIALTTVIPQATPAAGTVRAVSTIPLGVTIPAASASSSKTATPTVIPLTVTLPAASPRFGSTAAPQAITLNVNLPAVQIIVGVVVLPDGRTIIVRREIRQLAVELEDRVFDIPAENRTFEVIE
jgi:hypothetical protein